MVRHAGIEACDRTVWRICRDNGSSIYEVIHDRSGPSHAWCLPSLAEHRRTARFPTR
jgi:hypothetical protein